jgi:hypothetical protein
MGTESAKTMSTTDKFSLITIAGFSLPISIMFFYMTFAIQTGTILLNLVPFWGGAIGTFIFGCVFFCLWLVSVATLKGWKGWYKP